MRKLLVTAMVAIFALLMSGLAVADNVNVVAVQVGGTRTVTTTAGTGVAVDYWIEATGSMNLCDAADGTPATLAAPSVAGVSVTPATLTFTSCGLDKSQSFTFTPAAAGTFPVPQVGVSDPAGAYNRAPSTFTLSVSPAVITDTTAPVLSGVPGDIVAEATSAAGAVVSWPALTANDDRDGALPVNCSPASGTTFAIGTTSVSCTATDAAGNTGSASFNVTVRDTTAPTLAGLPDDILAAATSSSGAVVTYTNPTAADAVDPAPVVTCLPASGSQFSLSTTVVSCTARDASGNTSSAQTFDVVVRYASSGILQPINTGAGQPTSSFKLNSTIPVKIALTGDSSGVSNATIRIQVTRLAGVNPGEVIQEVVSTATPHSGSVLRYDASSNQYVYNMATKPLGAGTYLIQLDLGDGNPQTATIVIR